jgi:predicted outer membrane protein
MKGTKKQIIFLVLLFYGLYFTACYSSPGAKEVTEAPPKPAEIKTEKINEKDVKILESTYTNGLFELRLADTVKRYAAFENTQTIAMQVSDLYSDLNAQLVNLAAKKSVVLPNDIEPAQLQVLNKMSKIKGTALDKAYIDTTIVRHRKTIDLYRQYIVTCSDNELVACFTTAVPLFEKHLDIAIRMSNKK